MDAHALPVLVRIGKAGLTPSVIEEIKKHLKKRRVIKVKFLPAHAAGKSRKSGISDERANRGFASDKKAFARELAVKTNTRLVSQVGFVVVLQRQAAPTESAGLSSLRERQDLNTTNASIGEKEEEA